MQISLPDRQALIVALAEALKDAEIGLSGMYLRNEVSLDSVSESLKKNLEKCLGRNSLAGFIECQTIKKILATGHRLSGDEETLLKQVSGFDDNVETAKTLIQELKGLPFQYTVFVRGPQALSRVSKRLKVDIKISDQLSLVSSEVLRPRFPFVCGDDAIDEWVWYDSLPDDKRRFEPSYLYFTFKMSGFIGSSSQSKILDAFADDIRAFYGAALAHGILRPWGYKRDQLSILFLSEHGEGYLTPHGTMDSDIDRATYFYNTGVVQNEYRKEDKFYAVLEPVKKLFNCGNAVRLKTAAMWLLRAMSSQKPLDKILESAITLEVLLGDREMSDRLGLTKLMANRCAYALGKSASERQETLNFFQEFYRLRSDIVHTGRFVLGQEEEHLVDRGLRLASDMLVYEQGLSC